MEKIMNRAIAYNDMLYQTGGAIVDDSDTAVLSDESYEEQLNISGNGTMGSLDIPKINVELPIYQRGTDDTALSNGIGHLQGQALRTGVREYLIVEGLDTEGFRSKLLIRLDEMKEGDLFFLRIGNDTLAYKV
ncbi:MAG: sortase [Mediterraneibacter faecis]